MRIGRPPTAAILRFTPKYVVVETGCWQWGAHLNADGYGRFWWNGRTGPAHRFAYEHFVGPIPAGLYVDHLCRNRACVNPAHLQPVTPRENVHRGVGNGNDSKTHCPRGHAYDGQNLYVSPNQKNRVCRACKRRPTTKTNRTGAMS